LFVARSDPTFLPASRVAELVRQKQISPVELVEAHLHRIDQINPKINAFVEIDGDSALRHARTAETAIMRGEATGALHGVPVSIKSSIEVAGFRCEAGTKLRAGYRAKADAPLVDRLRKAGAIVLGTTNTPELLMAWETDNLLYGRTNNPWDLSRTAGGSSGGEAAAMVAVLSGCLPISVAFADSSLRPVGFLPQATTPNQLGRSRSSASWGLWLGQ
jgi:Asp-tRNA(Asn)/Glu-tRNA(Gln) amidotransferase A subunit family amidase